MVGGIDKYMQIVKCFRDEEPCGPTDNPNLPKLIVKCRLSEQEDILHTFEGLIKAFASRKFNGVSNLA